MSREIKFRVWDPDKKIMFEDFRQGQEGISLGERIHATVWETGIGYETLMQYTGLKDKNGIEIYEGDLIQNESGRIAEVKWHDSAGMFDCEPVVIVKNDNSDGFKTNCWSRWVRIIGNIHENKELLEPQNRINRCNECGYTEEDSMIYMDHHLCPNKNPLWSDKEISMNDLEINKAVAEKLGLKLFEVDEHLQSFVKPKIYIQNHIGFSNYSVDYCNNWGDAGPIIKENRIGIDPAGNDWQAFWLDPNDKYRMIPKRDKENPLRAAMLCFLEI